MKKIIKSNWFLVTIIIFLALAVAGITYKIIEKKSTSDISKPDTAAEATTGLENPTYPTTEYIDTLQTFSNETTNTDEKFNAEEKLCNSYYSLNDKLNEALTACQKATALAIELNKPTEKIDQLKNFTGYIESRIKAQSTPVPEVQP